ncbi:Protein kinase protein with adenine nucleotide alpha hydrolase-like domain [Forsythia ovata]|uniref:Protein kinase protein with adenine nucleotide alpha hydrolase-like domain n=1 Tax=Forsythia ovata TaxID=205694 RepID=A0ABD1RQ32_9LAMI
MGPNGKPYDLSPPETDISFVSSGRKSIDIISGRKSIDTCPSYYESFESAHTPPRLSSLSDMENHAFESWQLGRKSGGTITPLEFSYASIENDITSTSQTMVRSSILKLPGNTIISANLDTLVYYKNLHA